MGRVRGDLRRRRKKLDEAAHDVLSTMMAIDGKSTNRVTVGGRCHTGRRPQFNPKGNKSVKMC